MMGRLSAAAKPFQVDAVMKYGALFIHVPYMNVCMYVCIQIVLTKFDLASKAELQKSLKSVFIAISSKHGQSCLPYVHAVSSVGNIGMDALKLDIIQVHSQMWGNGDA